jgi:hypothetical protein
MLFFAFAFGVPFVLLIIAMVASRIYPGENSDLIDWKPTRSPETEVRLHSGEIDQMRASLNELRRRRGVPERSPEQATEHPRER